MVALQIVMTASACMLVFLILFTLRDVLLRTRSFLYQIVCILLVAGLPFVGFLLYLLIRPARTLREREVYSMLQELLARPNVAPLETPHPPKKKHPSAIPPTFKMSPKIES